MAENEGQETTVKKLPRRDFWKRNRIVGHTTVASGPLPTQDELPPTNPKESQNEVAEENRSPQFPGTPKEFVPTKGAKIDD